MARKVTNQILEMVKDGILDKDTVIFACLKYMSEDDVADMAHCNDFVTETDDHDCGECDGCNACACCNESCEAA